MGVIWITGLVGAGKTTIANEIVCRLRADGRAAVLLDGDALRGAFDERRYDLETRCTLAVRMSRLAALIEEQGVIAVVATVSLFHEVHALNRRTVKGYFEVFVDCPLSILKTRTTVYAQSENDEVVGVGQAAEFPLSPHFIVRNDGAITGIPSIAAEIVNAWKQHVGV
ncbi:MAG TPA: adenylyl-sulfate kinase [Rudaea sp.]|jgi:adenylylsulfate kinase-like enzyme|nr:adenylyl-sulfate kinase [Rudaea sp.]